MTIVLAHTLSVCPLMMFPPHSFYAQRGADGGKENTARGKLFLSRLLSSPLALG
jgi:hypothetical protein